jgi:hypothetical protein
VRLAGFWRVQPVPGALGPLPIELLLTPLTRCYMKQLRIETRRVDR